MKKGIKQFQYRYDNPNLQKRLNIFFAVVIFILSFGLTRIILTIPLTVFIEKNPNLIINLISIVVGLIICMPNALKRKQVTIFNDYIKLVNFSFFSQKVRFNTINEIKLVEKGKMPFKDRIYGVGNDEIVITYKGNKKVILTIDETDLLLSILHEKSPSAVFLIPNNQIKDYDGVIGSRVKVVVDRPVGTYHPDHKDIFYYINYGYIPNQFAGDGEEQDAYILGITIPLEEFDGVVVGVIHRKNDSEDKYVVAPEGMTFTKKEIMEQTKFQEKYFDIEIIC